MKQQPLGVIINISTAAARSVSQGGRMAMYGAAKAAVVHYTRNLASEVGPFDYCTRDAARKAFTGRLTAAPFASKVSFHHDNGPLTQPPHSASPKQARMFMETLHNSATCVLELRSA